MMPTEHGDGEQDELDEGDGGELGEPVGGFAHGKRVVNAVEVVVAFAPDELGGVEGGDDVEEEGSAAFDGLEHEVSDGPDVFVAAASREVAVVDGEDDQQADDSPEGDLADDVRMRRRVSERYCAQLVRGAEDLTDARKAGGDEGANRAELLFFGDAGPGGAAALRTRGERFDGHREERPHDAERNAAYGEPEQAIVEEDAWGVAGEVPRKQQGVFFDHASSSG